MEGRNREADARDRFAAAVLDARAYVERIKGNDPPRWISRDQYILGGFRRELDRAVDELVDADPIKASLLVAELRRWDTIFAVNLPAIRQDVEFSDDDREFVAPPPASVNLIRHPDASVRIVGIGTPRIAPGAPDGLLEWRGEKGRRENLALTILATWFDSRKAEELAVRFALDFLAEIPPEGGRIEKSDVDVWVCEVQEEEAIARNQIEEDAGE